MSGSSIELGRGTVFVCNDRACTETRSAFARTSPSMSNGPGLFSTRWTASARGSTRRCAATSELYRDFTLFAMGHDWTEKVAKWRRNAGKFATAHLGDQVEYLLPVLTAPWPVDGKHELRMDE